MDNIQTKSKNRKNNFSESIELSINDKRTITSQPYAKEYSLNELLKQVSEDNLHNEFDIGKPVGKEWS